MAVIKGKDLTKLEEWNDKELRKLKINLNNRIQSYKNSAKPKELPKSNPLFGLGEAECEELLREVQKAEKNLKFS
jgi:hypothetical protein